jgi:hypothetical protein
MAGKGNGDQEDQEESASWSCSICGASGTCAKGDESLALWLHTQAMHPTS